MYINKPLIKVERVRMSSRVTNQTPSGQKKKAHKVVNTSLTSFDNFRIFKRIGLNYWRIAMKKSKEQKNIRFKSKTMKPLFTAKTCLNRSMRLKKKNSQKFEGSSKCHSKLLKSILRYVSHKKSKGLKRSKIWKLKLKSLRENSQLLARKWRESNIWEKRSKTIQDKLKMLHKDCKVPKKKVMSKKDFIFKLKRSKWTSTKKWVKLKTKKKFTINLKEEKRNIGSWLEWWKNSIQRQITVRKMFSPIWRIKSTLWLISEAIFSTSKINLNSIKLQSSNSIMWLKVSRKEPKKKEK